MRLRIYYELVLVFDRFKGYSMVELHKKLPKGYCTLKTLYNYHARYAKADKKARELARDW